MGNFPYQPNPVDDTISLSEKEKLHHVKQATLLCLSPLYYFPNKDIITTVQYKYLPYCLRRVGVSGFLRIAVCNERQQRGRCVSGCHDASLWPCIQAPDIPEPCSYKCSCAKICGFWKKNKHQVPGSFSVINSLLLCLHHLPLISHAACDAKPRSIVPSCARFLSHQILKFLLSEAQRKVFALVANI